MLNLSQYSLMVGLFMVVVALACYILALTMGRSVKQAPVAAHARVGASVGSGSGAVEDPDENPDEGRVQPRVAHPPRALAQYGTYLTWLALLFLTVTLVLRSIVVGHGPFGNQYEFSVAFGWGMVLAYVYIEQKYHVRTIALLILPLTAGILLYALSVGSTDNPLVPALQNNLLLTIHVAVAIVAYGAFAVSFAAAVLYLIQPEEGRPGLPKPALLDEIGYRSVVIAFPLLTLVVVLGAVWASIAWGSYWSWDPKETASLLTWLVYGAYLHARVARGWVGRKAAWLLIAAFGCVLLTFFGNLFFSGLHSYGKT